jgi:general secretion pathway protein F
MPVFVYRAADRRGQTIDGVMEAPDARGVIERLQRDAYFPIRVTPQAERGPWLSLGGSSRVRRQDLLAFTQQLATLFEAGLPLDRALSIL